MLLRFSRWSNRLSTRLLVAYLVAWFLTAALIAASVTTILNLYGEQLVHYSVVEVARYFGAHVEFDERGRPKPIVLPRNADWIVSALPNDIGYRIYDDHGDVLLWSSPETQRAWTASGLEAAPGEADARVRVDGLDMEMRVVPVVGPQGRLWLQVSTSDRLIHLLHAGNSNRLGQIALLTALVSILLLGAVLFYALRRILAPVGEISLEAHAIELEQLDRRLKLEGVPAELVPLVESFNHALGRLERSYASQRRFLADTAHELKTPLALLRGQLELNGVADTRQLIRDVDHIARQVQQLLMLAEVSETHNYVRQPVKVERVADEVLAYLDPLARRRDVRLELLREGASPSLHCDQSALFVLLKNLVENAVAFAPRGTTVSVVIEPDAVRVRDRGPGIAAEHFPHLFERFWRAPERQDDGAGLGLAICLEAAQAHGWRLEARNVAPGAEFVVSFP